MTTTNGSHTATIEALTAQVRVLMVGSRQITLSVYRQLDWKPPADIEIFGRVRACKDSPDNEIELVGRDADGALVASDIRRPIWTDDACCEEFDHWLYHRHHAMHTPGGCHTVPSLDPARFYPVHGRLSWRPGKVHCPVDMRRNDLQDSSEETIAHANRWLRAEHFYLREVGALCDLDGLRRHWLEQAAAEAAHLQASQELYDKAKALPLIVLAGLR